MAGRPGGGGGPAQRNPAWASGGPGGRAVAGRFSLPTPTQAQAAVAKGHTLNVLGAPVKPPRAQPQSGAVHGGLATQPSTNRVPVGEPLPEIPRVPTPVTTAATSHKLNEASKPHLLLNEAVYVPVKFSVVIYFHLKFPLTFK